MKKEQIFSPLVNFLKFDFYFNGMKKYSHMGGRMGRKDFFLFQLSLLLIFFALVDISNRYKIPFLLPIYIILMFPPFFTSIIRRLHDTGRSGFIFLKSLIYGFFIILFGWFMLDGASSGIAYSIISVSSVFVIFYPVWLLFRKSQPEKNKFDDMPSHPIKHAIVLILFIIFFFFVLGVLGMLYVFPKFNEPLTMEETAQIDQIVKEYQNRKQN